MPQPPLPQPPQPSPPPAGQPPRPPEADRQLHEQIRASLSSGLQGRERFPVQPARTGLGGRLQRLKRADLINLTRQMSILWDVGIPLLRGLQILAHRTRRVPVRRVVTEIGEAVEQGSAFSDALARHPGIFSPFYIGAVRAGETSGDLGKSLRLVAEYLEREDRLRRKLSGALTYPVLALGIAALVVAVLFIRVLPVFAAEYRSAGVTLPTPTLVVLAIADFLRAYWPLLLIAILGISALHFALRRNPAYRLTFDSLWLRVPGLRDLLWRIYAFRFARLASAMLGSGVSVIDSLHTAGDATGNEQLRRRIERAAVEVEQGAGVAESLARHDAFPGMVTDMMAVGEETGAMDEVLQRMSVAYEEDVEAKLAGISTVIEPVLVLLLGGVVLVIALAMFMPYFNMQQVILGGQMK